MVADIVMLQALCGIRDRLGAYERKTLPPMLARLERGRKQELSLLQREWVGRLYRFYKPEPWAPAVQPYEAMARPEKPPGK